MPKSTKKQKEKSADFKKSKLKLGKGKKPANNAVDTSFKVHSIALPTQSIVADKSEAGPSTRRRHTLSELTSLLRHYSAGSRRDALDGLRELLSAHEQLRETSPTHVIPACCKLIADEDGSVRKALVEFLDWYLHRIPHVSILPHAPTLMLFVTSALTHIFPEIRVDSIHILNVLMSVIPDVVISRGPSGHGERVLYGYLGLIGGKPSGKETDAVSTSITVLSAHSKLLVISSLEKFISLSSTNNGSTWDSHWYLRSSFQTVQAYEAFIKTIAHQPSRALSISLPEMSRNLSNMTLLEVFDATRIESWQDIDVEDAVDGSLELETIGESDSQSNVALLVERSMHHVLVETWLDNAADAFLNIDNTTRLTNLRLVHASAKLAKTIYYSITRRPSLDNDPGSDPHLHLEVLLSHLSSYLPVHHGTLMRPEIEPLIQEMDLIFCELFTLYILGDPGAQSNGPSSQRRGREKTKLSVASLTESVERWLQELIHPKPTVRSPIGKGITSSQVEAVTPAFWAIMCNTTVENPTENPTSRLLRSLTEEIQGNQLSGRSRLALIQFTITLNLLQKEAEHVADFGFATTSSKGMNDNELLLIEARKNLVEVALLQLPKTLWEVGTSSPLASISALLLLLRCVQRSKAVWELSIMAQLAQRFASFFAVQHAKLGVIYGPFRKFTPASEGEVCQKLALDLAFALVSDPKTCHPSLPSQSPTQQQTPTGLTQSVDMAVEGTPREGYWKSLTSSWQGEAR